jgi:hypothetical protein
MTNTPDQQLTEEPQAERGGPGSGEPGSRDTGSDRPSAGPADRDSGKLDDQVESSDAEDPRIYGGTGELPPQDTKSAIPPYEGRTESSETNPRPGSGEAGGFGTKGESAGAATSQADKSASGSEGDDGVSAPGHTPGTGRAEDKR